MAEALLRHVSSGVVWAESAGLEPGAQNPLAVEVMREIGIDIRGRETKSVFQLYQAGRLFDYVITVCDEASAQRCPVFPGITKRLHWSFEDPASFTGSWPQRLEQTRRVRDEIQAKVEALCAEIGALGQAHTA